MSDGLEARIGTLTAGREWCKPWRTISGEALADPSLPQLQVLLEGVFTRRRLLALVRDFIVFEDDGSGDLVKKMAGVPPVPRRADRRRGDAARSRVAARRSPIATRTAATSRAGNRAAPAATGGSAWSGTPRGRARA